MLSATASHTKQVNWVGIALVIIATALYLDLEELVPTKSKKAKDHHRIG